MFMKAKNRYQAFAIHLFISLIIFILLSIIITYLWYPGFLFNTDGGWDGIRLIASIDFIIGPVLTLLLFKIGKPGLKLDLCIIGLIQLFCLAFGTWTVYQERPVAVIYSNGTFVAKSQVALELYNIDVKKIYELDTKKPTWVYVDIPKDEEQQSKLIISQLIRGPFYTFSERYLPYKDNVKKIIDDSIEISELNDDIKNNLSKNGMIFPYSARYGDGHIEIDKSTGEFIKIH